MVYYSTINDYDYLADDQKWFTRMQVRLSLLFRSLEQSNEGQLETTMIDTVMEGLHEMYNEIYHQTNFRKVRPNLTGRGALLSYLVDKQFAVELSSEQKKEIEAIFIATYIRSKIIEEYKADPEKINNCQQERTEFRQKLLANYPNIYVEASDASEIIYLHRFARSIRHLYELTNKVERKLSLKVGNLLEGTADSKRYIIGGRSAKDTIRRLELIEAIANELLGEDSKSNRRKRKAINNEAAIPTADNSESFILSEDIPKKPAKMSKKRTELSFGLTITADGLDMEGDSENSQEFDAPVITPAANLYSKIKLEFPGSSTNAQQENLMKRVRQMNFNNISSNSLAMSAASSSTSKKNSNSKKNSQANNNTEDAANNNLLMNTNKNTKGNTHDIIDFFLIIETNPNVIFINYDILMKNYFIKDPFYAYNNFLLESSFNQSNIQATSSSSSSSSSVNTPVFRNKTEVFHEIVNQGGYSDSIGKNRFFTYLHALQNKSFELILLKVFPLTIEDDTWILHEKELLKIFGAASSSPYATSNNASNTNNIVLLRESNVNLYSQADKMNYFVFESMDLSLEDFYLSKMKEQYVKSLICGSLQNEYYPTLCSLFLDIANALYTIHSRNMIHRDFTVKNFMVKRSNTSKPLVKLTNLSSIIILKSSADFEPYYEKHPTLFAQLTTLPANPMQQHPSLSLSLLHHAGSSSSSLVSMSDNGMKSEKNLLKQTSNNNTTTANNHTAVQKLVKERQDSIIYPFHYDYDKDFLAPEYYSAYEKTLKNHMTNQHDHLLYIPYEKSMDIWSLGMIFYYLCTGRCISYESLFTSQSENYHKINGDSWKTMCCTNDLQSFPENIKELIYSCLDWNPNHRPKIEQVLISLRTAFDN